MPLGMSPAFGTLRQRFNTDPPTLTAEDVATAIAALVGHPERVAYLIADVRLVGDLGTSP